MKTKELAVVISVLGGVLAVIAGNYIVDLQNEAKYYRSKFIKTAQCTISLEIYVRREQGEVIPESSYDMCDFNPFLEHCPCGYLKK